MPEISVPMPMAGLMLIADVCVLFMVLGVLTMFYGLNITYSGNPKSLKRVSGFFLKLIAFDMLQKAARF